MAQWVESAEVLAYGALNLKPREFEEMQPQEINKLLDGYLWRKEREQEKLAYFTYFTILPHVKRGGISINDILKPLRNDKKEEEQTAKKIEEKAKEKEYYKNMYNL